MVWVHDTGLFIPGKYKYSQESVQPWGHQACPALPSAACRPMPRPPSPGLLPGTQAPCCGPGPFSKAGRSAWSSHSWEEKNRDGEEDLPQKSRSLPGPGHLDRAPLSLAPLPQPPVGRLRHRRCEGLPSLQVDVKHSVLQRLDLLLPNLCGGGAGRGGRGYRINSQVPVPSAALPPARRRHPAPSRKQTHLPKINSLSVQTAQFLRLFLDFRFAAAFSQPQICQCS